MRGGRREGAGRKLGSPNKATIARQAEIAASGLTPLDFLLEVMRNEENDLRTRLEAAVKAAPYVHPKLAAVDHSHRGADGGPVQARYVISDHPMSEEEWRKQFVREG